MNNPLVNQAAMVLPVFLLSACLGGGGSFDLDSVDTEAPRPAPKYQDVSSEKPKAQKDQGGYGFAMRLKRRNWYRQANEDEVKLNENDWEATGLPTEPKKLPLKQESVISKVETNGDSKIYTSPYLSQNADSSHANGAHQPKNEVTDYKNFKYVYSGWFYKHAKQNFNLQNNIAQQGDDGYIFYHGKEPSRQLPAFGKVTYKGVWHFVTDTKKGQEFREIIQPSKKQGDRYSGFSGDDNEEYSNKNEETLQNGHEGYGFTSNLEVDFGNKKLTGKLIRNNVSLNNNNDKHTTQYYSLEAQVTGNRFNGTATATDKPKKDGETKEHPFVSDSSSLSGGFFGPQGEELGFRFLSDDKKVAVVGSAKTKDKAESGGGNGASGGTGAAASNSAAGTSSENSKLTTVLDAVELTLNDKKIKNLDNFSNAAQLVVDGIMIPLLPKNSESESNQADKGTNGGTAFTRKFDHTPKSDKKDTQAQTGTGGAQAASGKADVNGGKAETKTYEVEVCCSNLNYLKYGLLTRKTADNTGEGGNGSQAAAKTEQVEQSMFLQGERTDEKEIPNDQNVVYRGSWYGHIANDKSTSWSGNASDKEGGNRAEFTVNFDTKKITGTLTAENRQAETFTIEGMIQGNGFEGTAKTAELGFDLDQSNTTGTPKAYITNAKVQGGFYGPKAEELGGWFAYPGDKQTENTTVASGNGNSASSATVVFGAKRQKPVQ
ncbi:TPA: transferrin-binding protein-like solute binding protein [Neisseria meningitidis]|uniref:transferrin-binding protein-like solute binding protein n=1 Tax=Neisseria meningitidis TaxID=487 RepID=UPI000C31C979|nr:transferrin-binding protein-like solute binding protein [Neisseria meningitidis]MCL4982831.1 transferrin-binding protein-like solute binding protein [Neisseria meningitidis]MCL5705305.1 transferrin-binding protein-like solute binding protein [Neisseria meningitidis]MCL5719492.1 transferrin-binding protein-like solute binding protein [Neisseria meningitidis]MCL5828687.1 transferrin-binding protein-like solute binding protein [Neisseria meningitidis]MCL5840691.1 transferrin-binding protein-li